jgi:spermidine synthase
MGGLALGSWAVGRYINHFSSKNDLLAFYGKLEIAIGVYALVLLFLIETATPFYSLAYHFLFEYFWFYQFFAFMGAFTLLILPASLMGGTMPVLCQFYISRIDHLGTRTGRLYGLNTIGAIIGSFAAGFLLIPLVGKETGLKLVITFQFIAAFSAYFHGKYRGWFETGTKRYQWIATSALAVAAVFLISYYPCWNRNILSRGWYRNFQDIEIVLERTSWPDAFRFGPELLAQQQNNLKLVFYGDGIGGFTTVEKEITSIGTIEYALNNSGKPDASSHGDRLTQTLSGHFPLLFHPDPQKILVIGLASGMTIGEVLLYPVEQVDVLEINDQVVKACQLFFTPFNNDCLNDPRTRLVVQDGRNHLELTNEKYDMVISEPSNPWMSGLANLYSLDFFKLVRSRLNENGIFAQWIQSYEIDWDTFVLVGRTFKEVFPEGVLIKLGPGDYMLMGFASREGPDWETAEKNIEYARRSFHAAIADYKFLAWLVVTEDLYKLFGTGPLHTDDHPRLEFSAPKKLYGTGTDRNQTLEQVMAQRRQLSSNTLTILIAHDATDQLLDLVEFAASVNVPLFNTIHQKDLTTSQQNRYHRVLTSFCKQTLVPSYSIFSDIALKKECAEIQIGKIRQKMATGNRRADDYYNLGLSLITTGRIEEAISQLESTVNLDPLHVDAYMAIVLLMAEKGNMGQAINYFKQTLKIAPMNPQAQKYMGMAKSQQGNLQQAVFHLSKALEIMPDDVSLLNELEKTLAQLKKNQ